MNSFVMIALALHMSTISPSLFDGAYHSEVSPTGWRADQLDVQPFVEGAKNTNVHVKGSVGGVSLGLLIKVKMSDLNCAERCFQNRAMTIAASNFGEKQAESIKSAILTWQLEERPAHIGVEIDCSTGRSSTSNVAELCAGVTHDVSCFFASQDQPLEIQFMSSGRPITCTNGSKLSSNATVFTQQQEG